MKRLASHKVLFIGALTLTLSLGALPAAADGCSSGPSAAPNDAVKHLEEDITQWGVYCGGSPSYLQPEIQTSAKATILQFSYLGGVANDYTHLYRNLSGAPDANSFVLKLRFRFQPSSDQSAQALQFSMNSWVAESRYEWAVQWLNDGGKGRWGFWNGYQFVDLGVSQRLTPGEWHTIKIHGAITDKGKVFYNGFSIDSTNHKIKLEVDPIAYPGWPDQLSVATTLVGIGGESYELFLDRVNFKRETIVPKDDKAKEEKAKDEKPKKDKDKKK